MAKKGMFHVSADPRVEADFRSTVISGGNPLLSLERGRKLSKQDPASIARAKQLAEKPAEDESKNPLKNALVKGGV